METTEMDVEQEQQSASFKRFTLKNSIVTNFGDDYVFQITPKEDWTAMAVSLSNNAVKIYSSSAVKFHRRVQHHRRVRAPPWVNKRNPTPTVQTLTVVGARYIKNGGGYIKMG